MDASLFYLIGGIVLVGIIALLYTRFYRTREQGGTDDELNWVNKSNYNIASPDNEIAELEKASPAEAREIARKMTEWQRRGTADGRRVPHP